MQYCIYYQAYVTPAKCWFVVAILKSFEHLCFVRTFDTKNSTLEFFVPPLLEPTFLEIMKYFTQCAMVRNLERLPNRFEEN